MATSSLVTRDSFSSRVSIGFFIYSNAGGDDYRLSDACPPPKNDALAVGPSNDLPGRPSAYSYYAAEIQNHPESEVITNHTLSHLGEKTVDRQHDHLRSGLEQPHPSGLKLKKSTPHHPHRRRQRPLRPHRQPQYHEMMSFFLPIVVSLDDFLGRDLKGHRSMSNETRAK